MILKFIHKDKYRKLSNNATGILTETHFSIKILTHSLCLALSNKYLEVIIQRLEPKILNFSLNILGSIDCMMNYKYSLDRAKSRLLVSLFIWLIPIGFFFKLTRKLVFHTFQLKFQEHYSRLYGVLRKTFTF